MTIYNPEGVVRAARGRLASGGVVSGATQTTNENAVVSIVEALTKRRAGSVRWQVEVTFWERAARGRGVGRRETRVLSILEVGREWTPIRAVRALTDHAREASVSPDWSSALKARLATLRRVEG